MSDLEPKQYLVCVRDAGSASDIYVGPFRTPEGAERVRRRLEITVIKRRAADEVLSVWIEPVRPGSDIEYVRDELIERLDSLGYTLP